MKEFSAQHFVHTYGRAVGGLDDKTVTEITEHLLNGTDHDELRERFGTEFSTVADAFFVYLGGRDSTT